MVGCLHLEPRELSRRRLKAAFFSTASIPFPVRVCLGRLLPFVLYFCIYLLGSEVSFARHVSIHVSKLPLREHRLVMPTCDTAFVALSNAPFSADVHVLLVRAWRLCLGGAGCEIPADGCACGVDSMPFWSRLGSRAASTQQPFRVKF